MLQILKETFRGYDTADLIAERALVVMENSGMIPPKSRNPRYDAAKALKYSRHPFLEYPEESMVNEWESEDETK